MKSKISKALLVILFSVCIFDAMPEEDLFASQTAPAAISSMRAAPGTAGDHHWRRHRRRIRRRIFWRRHHHHRRF